MSIVDFDTDCWGDPWIQGLSPLARLLFIYLWTNPHRNISGLYVITKKTMNDESGLNKKQVDDLLEELHPKVKYDPIHSVCFVVKHARRQFLRGEKISPRQREGIRRHVLKLRWHPFFKDFVASYPEIFLEGELDTLLMGIDTLSKGIYTLGGGGKGGGEGSFKEEKEKEGVEGKEEGETTSSPDPKTFVEKFVSLFNLSVQYIPKVSEITETRRKKVLIREKEKRDLNWWGVVFKKADLVLIPGKGVSKDWFPNFDWLIDNDTNAVKVFEDRYADAKRHVPRKMTPGEIFLEVTDRQEDINERRRQETLQLGNGQDGVSSSRTQPE